MPYTITPQQADIYTAVRAFLIAITGGTVVKGIPNRVAMPQASPGWITTTLIRRRRLNYNIDTWDETLDDPTSWSSETHYEVVMQLDIVGVNAFDWCGMIETLWFDDIGVQALLPTCAPLYTNPSHMAPLEDSEDQYEERWILEVVLQYNPVTTTPLQTADEAVLNVINVYEAYPP
jgi:hypothetical protein